jgi:hypothetical protein
LSDIAFHHHSEHINKKHRRVRETFQLAGGGNCGLAVCMALAEGLWLLFYQVNDRRKPTGAESQ